MAKGVDATPKLVFQHLSGMRRAFLQSKVSVVGLSFGICPCKKFSNRTFRPGTEIKRRKGAGEGDCTLLLSKSCPILLTMKMTFNLGYFFA